MRCQYIRAAAFSIGSVHNWSDQLYDYHKVLINCEYKNLVFLGGLAFGWY